MARDHFAILGLTPGRHDPRVVAARFLAERERLRAGLLDAAQYTRTRQELDELYVAYAALRDPARQVRCLRAREPGADRVAVMRQLIAASLEDGLLRASRRQAIIERAQELGLNGFQTQLLIAQVQFGEDEVDVAPVRVVNAVKPEHPRAWARAAAAGVLALAMFLTLVHWVGR